MKYKSHLAICLFFLFTSCYVQIDPYATNTTASTFAVIGEIMYAMSTLILLVCFRLIRSIGIGSILFGLLGLLIDQTFCINPLYIICGGILLLSVSFIEIKQYIPHINISRKKMVFPKHTESKSSKKDIFIQLLVTIATLIIEYAFFVES